MNNGPVVLAPPEMAEAELCQLAAARSATQGQHRNRPIPIALHYGTFSTSQEESYAFGRKAYAAGWKLGTHANGDVAIEKILNVYERLDREFAAEFNLALADYSSWICVCEARSASRS